MSSISTAVTGFIVSQATPQEIATKSVFKKPAAALGTTQRSVVQSVGSLTARRQQQQQQQLGNQVMRLPQQQRQRIQRTVTQQGAGEISYCNIH